MPFRKKETEYLPTGWGKGPICMLYVKYALSVMFLGGHSLSSWGCRAHHVYLSLRREVALPGGGSDAGRFWKDGVGDVMGTIALTTFLFHKAKV